MADLPAPDQPHPPQRVSKTASNQSVNLNHLLNFTLPPRQSRPLSNVPRRSRKTGNSHGVWNKERFVNAQYRFVMDPSGDYTVHFADPDIFFQWHDILQVIIPRSSALAPTAATTEQPFALKDESQTNCPICLSPPAAPRMTKCGHIFCFHCILHYLGTSDNKWARCPICFDSVNERQLKSVKWFGGPADTTDDVNGSSAEASSSSSSTLDNSFETTLRPGSSLRMRLIQRPQITTLALPRSQTWPSDLVPPHQAPFHFLPDVYNFSKFMLATPAYLISDLNRDLEELASERRILADMSDDLGIVFIEAAETKIRQQIAKATALDTLLLQGRIDKALKDQHDLEERLALRRRKEGESLQTKRQTVEEEAPTDFLALKSQGHAPTSSLPFGNHQVSASQGSLPRPPSTQLRSQPRQRRNLNPPPSTSAYYYYQAASGIPIYLHPLDIRTLLSHFNSYSSFPDDITVRVEAYSEGTVDDDLRRRCKYLAHMPEGADVIFIEANLENVVGAEGLKPFEGALKSRAMRRKEKSRKDDRAKVRAEEKEREKQKLWTSSYAASSSVPTVTHNQGAVDDFSALRTLSHASGPSPDATSSPPQEVPAVDDQQQTTTNAWGARSFASALHSSPSHATNRGQQRARVPLEDEWDMDAAWHELEQRAGGRKKRGARLVVLGGGGGRRR